MESPFPGMDPYLEGHLWPDVHHALASKLRQQLAPRLRPRYTARIELYIVEDNAPEGEIGIMYPDVEILLVGQTGFSPSSSSVSHNPTSRVGTAPLIIPLLQSVEVRIATVEIHDAANNQLVTCIEILSPINKREPGLTPYRQKRQRLYGAGVHLIEIDLLRRGTRPITHPRIPDQPCLIALTRAHAGAVEVWSIALRDPLPTIGVPLRDPDPDVLLDLQQALAAIYDEAGYDLSIDYDQPPPPPALSESDTARMRAILD